MHRPDGTLRLAGELATTDPIAGGRFSAEFEYSRDWITDPTALALDPVSLPLHPQQGRRYQSDAEQLATVASDWGVPNAKEILEQVTVAVARFGPTARQLEVAGALEQIQADIQRRLRLINAS
jgi:hypothetical protein